MYYVYLRKHFFQFFLFMIFKNEVNDLYKWHISKLHCNLTQKKTLEVSFLTLKMFPFQHILSKSM